LPFRSKLGNFSMLGSFLPPIPRQAEDSGLYIIALLIAEPEEPFGLQRPA
jgi:hypothetical protein